MYRTANAVMTHQKTIILVGTAVSIIMLMGASNLETGFDLEEFLPQNNPAINLFNKISDEFPYASEQQEYILIEGEVATVETLRGISETHKNMEDDTLIARKPDGTTKTISIMTIIKDAVKNNNSLITVFNIDQTLRYKLLGNICYIHIHKKNKFTYKFYKSSKLFKWRYS